MLVDIDIEYGVTKYNKPFYFSVFLIESPLHLKEALKTRRKKVTDRLIININYETLLYIRNLLTIYDQIIYNVNILKILIFPEILYYLLVLVFNQNYHVHQR